jgi:hypothetical protein
MLTDSDDALWIRFHVIRRRFLVHRNYIVNEATAVSLFHPIHSAAAIVPLPLFQVYIYQKQPATGNPNHA